jgi:hypothetical protein
MKISYIAAILGMTLYLVGVTPASAANTVTLVCSRGASVLKLNLSIDLTAKTVASWTSNNPSGSDSPDPADITDDSVTWTSTSDGGTFSYSLDRNTGALSQKTPNGITDLWTCTKASRVF